jgi:hypothetical protein
MTAGAARCPAGTLGLLALLPAVLAACRTAPPPTADAEPVPTAPAAPDAAPAAPPDFRADADLDGDGAPETLAAYLAADRSRGFLTVGEGPDRWTSPLYPMWKARAARLADPAARLVVLGIWSRTPRHAEPEPHRTVWVLEWDGARLVERWRGSALARPLRDFVLGDADGDGRDELLALESTPESCWLAAYRWDGFGFVGLARRPLPCAGLRLDETHDPLEVAGPAGPRRMRLRGRALVLEELGT